MSVSGDYITDTDLYNFFGQENIEKWARVETSGGMSMEDRLAAAIAYGEAELEGRFTGSMYTVPFTVTGNPLVVLKRWMCIFAGKWLREARPPTEEEVDHFDTLMKQVEEDIRDLLSGTTEWRVGIDEDAYYG